MNVNHYRFNVEVKHEGEKASHFRKCKNRNQVIKLLLWLKRKDKEITKRKLTSKPINPFFLNLKKNWKLKLRKWIILKSSRN